MTPLSGTFQPCGKLVLVERAAKPQDHGVISKGDVSNREVSSEKVERVEKQELGRVEVKNNEVKREKG